MAKLVVSLPRDSSSASMLVEGQSSLQSNAAPALQLPAGAGAGQLAGVHYFRPGRRGARDVHGIRIFSVTETYWYDVPPMPFECGIRSGCQCISLASKIYVLGGEQHEDLASKEVFVYDLLTAQWARCASMLYRRTNFCVGILHGKLYAIGGRNNRRAVLQIEEYDPRVNRWSRKTPNILDDRINSQVAAVGEKLLVLGGFFLDPESFEPGRYEVPEQAAWVRSVKKRTYDDRMIKDTDWPAAAALYYYHPVESRWTELSTDVLDAWSQKVFFAAGTICRLDELELYMYDLPDFESDSDSDSDSHSNFQLQPVNPWKLVHTLHIARECALWNLRPMLGCQPVLLGGELWMASSPNLHGISSLLRTRGFGRRGRQIDLEIAIPQLGTFDNGSTIIFTLDL